MTSKEATHLYRLQQWGEAVKDCKSSGKTVAAWCSEQGISKKTYYNWQKIVRDAACKKLTLRQEAPLPAPVFRRKAFEPKRYTGAHIIFGGKR